MIHYKGTVVNTGLEYLFRFEEASIAGMGETTHNDDVMPPNRT